MNCYDLINVRYKKRFVFLLLIILFIGTLSYISNLVLCDAYNTNGYVLNGELIIHVPVKNPDTLSNLEYIKILDKKYEASIINISEVLFDQSSLVNYQEITFDSNFDFKDNQVVLVTIYYNKEKVSEKIRKILF